jgi:hypothetical protein
VEDGRPEVFLGICAAGGGPIGNVIARFRGGRGRLINERRCRFFCDRGELVLDVLGFDELVDCEGGLVRGSGKFFGDRNRFLGYGGRFLIGRGQFFGGSGKFFGDRNRILGYGGRFLIGRGKFFGGRDVLLGVDVLLRCGSWLFDEGDFLVDGLGRDRLLLRSFVDVSNQLELHGGLPEDRAVNH